MCDFWNAVCVPISRGKHVIVDIADYDTVAPHKWTADPNGKGGFYVVRRLKNKKVRLHRLLMNPPCGLFVDHVNRDTFDNRRCNLRVCSKSENGRNVGPKSVAKSAYKGVTRTSNGRYFQSAIMVNGKSHWVGTFKSEVDAARAYDAAARRHHGQFAYLNFPDQVEGR